MRYFFKTLDSLDNESLEGHFSEEEVTKALSDLGGDKVLGPDGFTLAFWKFCWPIVGGEVMQVFEEFHLQNACCRSLNATFLVLIPKKGGASDVQDFRPISNDFWSFFHCCRASSCKVYGVVPPPHQLLVGVQSSGNELNVKTSSNPCLTSSDGSSTPTPLVSSFDFVNSDLSFWCFSCDAYLDAQAIL
ncbi:hypothetical protein CK203_029827 [Vitis vinifera]|uniref:Uncharacterized protein n=1 Tax=Vitis vinifera TaxID=29760 RepID=A0A438DPB4_VITVI|nr:hypothetical protein CK203_088174 [Vitis vinifera]RVW94743.1 hypothetical protein CK203_029827 [Vitis vinifera]